MDFIIVDVLEGLPVPIVSDPTDVVPLWNQSMKSLLKAIFVFVEDYLQDEGTIIIIHPFQVDAKSTILEYCIEYSFETCKEWLLMNPLHLCSPLNKTLIVNSLPKSLFCIDTSLNCVKLNYFPIVWFPLIFIVLFRLSILEHTFLWRRDPPSSLTVPAPLWKTLGSMLHQMNGSKTSQLGRTRPWVVKSLDVDHERRIWVSGRCSLRLLQGLVTFYWTTLPWPMRHVLSILAYEIGLLPPLHLEHNLDFISCYVVSSMQVLLSVLAVAWIAILWPLRRKTSYFLPCLLLWCVL